MRNEASTLIKKIIELLIINFKLFKDGQARYFSNALKDKNYNFIVRYAKTNNHIILLNYLTRMKANSENKSRV
jgi:hypothetical protein